MIYISHPFSGNEAENKTKAHLIATKLAAKYPAVLFVNPLTAMKHAVAAKLPYGDILDQCIELLSRCDGIIMTGNWRESQGCTKEYKFAKAVKKNIYDGIMGFEQDFENENE